MLIGNFASAVEYQHDSKTSWGTRLLQLLASGCTDWELTELCPNLLWASLRHDTRHVFILRTSHPLSPMVLSPKGYKMYLISSIWQLIFYI